MQLVPKRLPAIALLLGSCLLFSGCLKTRIMTGKAASNQQAEITWAHGFVNGLVPPINAPLDTEETCGDAGVSEVYFRQTFVQWLAQGLTFSLYAPQRFTATCAAGGGMSSVPTPPSYLLRGDSDIKASASTRATSESSSTKTKRDR